MLVKEEDRPYVEEGRIHASSTLGGQTGEPTMDCQECTDNYNYEREDIMKENGLKITGKGYIFVKNDGLRVGCSELIVTTISYSGVTACKIAGTESLFLDQVKSSKDLGVFVEYLEGCKIDNIYDVIFVTKEQAYKSMRAVKLLELEKVALDLGFISEHLLDCDSGE